MIQPFLNLAIARILVILPHLLEAVTEPEEYAEGQLGITACLMLSADAIYVKILCYLAETAI